MSTHDNRFIKKLLLDSTPSQLKIANEPQQPTAWVILVDVQKPVRIATNIPAEILAIDRRLFLVYSYSTNINLFFL